MAREQYFKIVISTIKKGVDRKSVVQKIKNEISKDYSEFRKYNIEKVEAIN